MSARRYIRSSRAWWARANQIAPTFARPDAHGAMLASELEERGYGTWASRARELAARLSHGKPEEFILSASEGDPQIEIVVVFHDFNRAGRHAGKLAAKVTIFDESWPALVLWRDLWDTLAERATAGGGMAGDFSCQPDEFEEILRSLGFEDTTPYQRED